MYSLSNLKVNRKMMSYQLNLVAFLFLLSFSMTFSMLQFIRANTIYLILYVFLFV
jgi:hypothetical protein